jgi:phage I-like protein
MLSRGQNRTTKGLLDFSEKSAALVLAAHADYGNELIIDYEHASLTARHALSPSEAGKAAGWLTPAVRDGELWATAVSWTQKARDAILAREYRYTSPVLSVDKDGLIEAVHGCALTGNPATKCLTPLVASKDETLHPEPKMKTLLAALSLSAEATEAEAVTALAGLQSSHAELLSAVGAKTKAEAIGTLMALRDKAARTDAAEVELSALKTSAAKSAKAAKLADAVKALKVAPAQVEALSKLDDETLDAYLAATAPMFSAKPAKETAPTDLVSLSAEDLTMAAIMGIAPSALAAHKAKLGGVKSAAPLKAAE